MTRRPASRVRKRARRLSWAMLARLALAGPALASAGPPHPGPAARATVPILTYHRFGAAAGPTTVTLAAFRDQLAWLSAHGYRIVPLRQALAELAGAAPPQKAVAITADDGNESVFTALFPLIRAERIPVTLFIYPSAISNAPYALTWAQLKEMRASGLVDIESHTFWHPNFKTERRRRSPADYQAFVDMQLARSRQVIETRLGGGANLLAWPFGIVDPDLEAAARRAGYVAAFGYGGGPAAAGDDILALPRIPITDADRGARFGGKLTARERRGEGE